MKFKIVPRAGDPFVGDAVKIEGGGVLCYKDNSGLHYLAPGEWTKADQVETGGAAAAPRSAAAPSDRQVGPF